MSIKLLQTTFDALRGVRRIRTPTRIQLESTECGSTSLMIILAYYKKYVSSAELRRQCGVSRDGTDAYDLIKAAEYYDLEAEGFYATVDELRKEVNYPAILFWDSNHFVVLEGFDKNKVFINDPNRGTYATTIEEFAKHYSGIVLTFFPKTSFKKGGEKPRFIRPLLNRVRSEKKAIASFLLLELFLVMAGLIFAIFSQVFVDEILPNPGLSWTSLFVAAFALLVIFYLKVQWLQNIILNRLNAKLSINLSTQFFLHVLQLPVFFFHQRYVAEIVRRMNLNVQVAAFIIGSLTKAGLDIFLIGCYLMIVYQFDPLISLLILAIIFVNIVIVVTQNELRKNIYAQSQQIIAEFYGLTIDSVTNMSTIHMAGSSPFLFQRVIGTNSAIVNTYQNIGARDALINSLARFSQLLSSVLFVSIAGWKVINGTMTAGVFVTLQILIGLISGPIGQIINIGMHIPLLKMDLMRIDDVLSNRIDPIIALAEKEKGEEVRGDVTFKNVSFGYNPLNEPMIDSLSFSISKGEFVGITGPNGSGKSTVMRLIAGQYQPWQGEIFYDNYNIYEKPVSLYPKNVLIVEKDGLFVKGTVRENLTLWNPYIDDEELNAVCKAACISDVIEARNNGYNTIIDESASNFSLGQKQRLDIARALLYRPKILLLDEAVSGLESDLVKKLLHNIKERVNTLIVISHQKNVLDLCDRVLVIESGSLMQKGRETS